MDINVKSSISPATQPIQTTSVGRPDGSNLFTNRNTDQLSESTGEPLQYRNQEAHNPQLNQPGNVSRNPQTQSEEAANANITNEYEATVLAAINEKVTDKEALQKLVTAFISGKENELQDETLLETLSQIMADSREEVNKANKRDSNAPIPRKKESTDANGEIFKEHAVKEQMKNYPELFVNGKLTDKGNQMLRAIMTGNLGGDAQAQKINNAANAALGFIPTINADSFDARIGVEFEQAFKDQIASLPQDQQKKMEYLFNMDPSNPEVKAFIDKATAQIQSKWGADVNIAKESLSYNFKINGEYQLALDTKIKQLSPQLSNANIEHIKNYLIAKQNGQEFQITDNLKAIADKAHAAALSDVQSLYGVPKSWVPDGSINLATFLGTPIGKAYQAANDQILATEARINSLPEGPEKSKYIELLKVISQALSDLKEMLFQTAAADAAQSANMSRVQVELVKDKADKMKAVAEARETERKQEQEIAQKEAEQAKKQEWMGPLMIAAGALLSLVAVVVTAITFGATAGLIALAITVVILVLTLAPGGTDEKTGASRSAMDFIMSELNKGIDSLSTALFGADTVGAQVFGTFFRMFLIVNAVAVAVASGQVAILAPLLITFVMESGFIQRMMEDCCKATGAEKPPEYVAMIVNAVIVVGIVAASIKCGGKGADKFAKLDKMLGLTKASAALKSVGGMQAVQGTIIGIETVNVGLQAGVQIAQAEAQFKMAELKESLAKKILDTSEAEAKIEEITAMIKMLQKIIDAMFGQIQDLTDWAAETGRQMDQRWADKTELLTNLNSAQ